MKDKTKDLLIGSILLGILTGSTFWFQDIKERAQIILLVLCLITLLTQIVKKPFNTSIFFYFLLGILIFTNLFFLSNIIIGKINPNDGWSADSFGVRQKVMSINWIWGILSGIIITPILITNYNKRVHRNKIIEISFTVILSLYITFLIFRH